MAFGFAHAFAFLIAVNAAFAITCYKCDSTQSSLCNYRLASFTMGTSDCTNEGALGTLTNWVPKQCVKIVAKGKDGSEYIARDCMPAVGDTVCSAVAKTLGAFSSLGDGNIDKTDCFTCNEDKCNSASKYAAYTFLGVLLAAVAFLF